MLGKLCENGIPVPLEIDRCWHVRDYTCGQFNQSNLPIRMSFMSAGFGTSCRRMFEFGFDMLWLRARQEPEYGGGYDPIALLVVMTEPPKWKK